jgi:chaperonin GroES
MPGEWRVLDTKNQANPSGIRPVEYKVVVYPKPVEEVTKGGIIVPVEKVVRDEFATQEATIVAVADSAFSEADIWGSNPPKVGDVVLFAKYAGLLRKGKDGKDYRVLNDKDICAVLD